MNSFEYVEESEKTNLPTVFFLLWMGHVFEYCEAVDFFPCINGKNNLWFKWEPPFSLIYISVANFVHFSVKINLESLINDTEFNQQNNYLVLCVMNWENLSKIMHSSN